MKHLHAMCCALSLLSGCYSYTTVQSDQLTALRSQCGVPENLQRGSIKVTEKTQIEVREEWRELCESRGRPAADSVRLRTPDPYAPTGAALAAVGSVLFIIYMATSWELGLSFGG